MFYKLFFFIHFDFICLIGIWFQWSKSQSSRLSLPSTLFFPLLFSSPLSVLYQCCLAGFAVNSGPASSVLSHLLPASSRLWKVFLDLNAGTELPLYIRVYEVLTKSFPFSLSLSPSLPFCLPPGPDRPAFNFNSLPRKRVLCRACNEESV